MHILDFCFCFDTSERKIVYLTYGELYELPFLYALALSKNGWVDVHEIHALKYKDDSKVSKMFEGLYKKRIHHVIYHSQRTYDILKMIVLIWYMCLISNTFSTHL